jgi:nitroimidazol reductase NimA-like FMN-containing flavoprotein (pyridoxamine 5'-phosphate oxidase superfamily)
MGDSEQNDESWRGQVGRLTAAEMEEFLAGNILCRLAVLDPDGWPYIIPVWFQYKDGGYYIIPRERSVWANYMARDPRVSLVIDETGRQRKVMVRGEAEMIEEPNIGGKWVEIAREMSLRYLGPNGPSYLEPTLPEPRWLFFVKPIKTTTWQGVDWARRYKHSDWGANQ